jgi:opacity protein-like surface antigen
MLKKINIVLLICFLISVDKNLFAQSAGINFLLGFPQGEFKDNVKRTGIGLGLEGFYWVTNDAPFGIGLNLSYMNYGSETRRAPFSYTIPDVTVDVERTNNIANFNVVFRLATRNSLLRPYLDLLFGGAYLFTETKIVSTRNNEEVTTDTNFDDFAWSYGAGAGLMYKVFTDKENGSEIFLDFKVRYIYGSDAKYLKEGDVRISNSFPPIVTYNTRQSKTDLLNAQFGVQAYFNSF